MPVLSTHQYRARAVGEFISLDPEAAPEAELDFEQHRLSTAAALGRDSVPTRDAEAVPEAARTITPETTPPADDATSASDDDSSTCSEIHEEKRKS